jgi:hypothetical protein
MGDIMRESQFLAERSAAIVKLMQDRLNSAAAAQRTAADFAKQTAAAHLANSQDTAKKIASVSNPSTAPTTPTPTLST